MVSCQGKSVHATLCMWSNHTLMMERTGKSLQDPPLQRTREFLLKMPVSRNWNYSQKSQYRHSLLELRWELGQGAGAVCVCNASLKKQEALQHPCTAIVQIFLLMLAFTHHWIMNIVRGVSWKLFQGATPVFLLYQLLHSHDSQFPQEHSWGKSQDNPDKFKPSKCSLRHLLVWLQLQCLTHHRICIQKKNARKVGGVWLILAPTNSRSEICKTILVTGKFAVKV